MREADLGDQASAAAEPNHPIPARHAGNTSGGAAAEDVTRLSFELHRSAFYHDRLSRGFGFAHRLTMMAMILLGSGAAVSLSAGLPWLGPTLGLTVTLIGSSQLVWDFSGRAAEHKALRNRFYDLLTELEAGADPKDLSSRMTAIYSSEPPIIHRVNEAAHRQSHRLVYGTEDERA